MDAVGEEKCSGAGVVKLTAIVTLDDLNGGAELRRYMGKEVSKCTERVRFHKGSPQMMQTIIQNDQVIFVTRDTNDR
jgi:hypothetical protein